MGKVLYDFLPVSAITPYVVRAPNVGFIDSNPLLAVRNLPTKASLALWNIDSQWRALIEGRYVAPRTRASTSMA
jgi:hypothetical protein